LLKNVFLGGYTQDLFDLSLETFILCNNNRFISDIDGQRGKQGQKSFSKKNDVVLLFLRTVDIFDNVHIIYTNSVVEIFTFLST